MWKHKINCFVREPFSLPGDLKTELSKDLLGLEMQTCLVHNIYIYFLSYFKYLHQILKL